MCQSYFILTVIKGTLLENFLTREPEDFKKFMRLESSPLDSDENILKQAYRYAQVRALSILCDDPLNLRIEVKKVYHAITTGLPRQTAAWNRCL
jgi:hypothetical protein